MKKNIFEKYAIIASYLFVVLFGVMGSAADRNRDGVRDGTTSRSTMFNMEPTREDQRKPHIGLQLGYVNPQQGGYNSASQYGLEVGYQPYVPLAAALELSSFSSGREGGSLRRTDLMAKGTYNFGGETPVIRYSFIGAALGPVYDSEAGQNELNLGVKFLAGFDIPLNRAGVTRSKTFTLGATANYLAVANAQDNIVVNGQLKYWF
jgi:hypothetical protein